MRSTPPAEKNFDAAIHIRAQLPFLEQKHKTNSSAVSLADFHWFNNTVFRHVNNYLTAHFYPSDRDRWNFSVTSPPHVFVSVDDLTLKHLLVQHLTSYRDPQRPVVVMYVNNSAPIKHARLMKESLRPPSSSVSGSNATVTANSSDPVMEGQPEPEAGPDVDMIPTMFDWYGLSEASFILAYRCAANLS